MIIASDVQYVVEQFHKRRRVSPQAIGEFINFFTRHLSWVHKAEKFAAKNDRLNRRAAGEVRVHADARMGDGLTLTVQDTGESIPESMRERIFDEFAQLSNQERDRTKGTGLGLAICRPLIDGMGGEIRVADGNGRIGSTFLITLPSNSVVSEEQEAAVSKAPLDGSRPQFAGQVLVVEDHEPSRVLMQRLLREVGLEVDVAVNGRDAIEHMEQTRPDLVLLDFMMPVMNGAEAIQIIRSRSEWDDVPVVILTAQVSEQIRPLQIEGVTAYLSKPIELAKLVDLLADVLPLQKFPAMNGPSEQLRRPPFIIATRVITRSPLPGRFKELRLPALVAASRLGVKSSDDRVSNVTMICQ